MSDYTVLKCGGQGRNRTADASLFRAALYRLSYLAARRRNLEFIKPTTGNSQRSVARDLWYTPVVGIYMLGEKRLGDVIDDFCVKCRRLTNHSIVSLVGNEAAKVRCRTCYHDHDYRHEQAPPTKKELKKLEEEAKAAAQALADQNGEMTTEATPKIRVTTKET